MRGALSLLRAPPGLLLSQQIIGVGINEQFDEHRMHDALPTGRHQVGAARSRADTPPQTGWAVADCLLGWWDGALQQAVQDRD